MEQARLRGEYRLRAGPDPIELGNEPPLSVDGESNHLVDRRRISVQWFSGTILTGLCGAALMGGAVFASLDGESHFASLPERVETALRGAIGVGEKQNAARKADKLPPPSETNVARQVIRVSTMTKAGQREVVRVRPYVRIAGNLSLTVSDLSANIPPFNAQRMLAESTPGGAVSNEDAAEAAAPDAEVSFVTRELASQLPRLKVAALLPMDDVIARVRDTANWTGNRTAVAGIQPSPSYKLAYAAEGTPDPYAGFEARIVPENITLLPKTATQTGGGNGWNEKNFILKKGESVPTILRELNATPSEIAAITGALGARGKEGALKEGQRVRILLNPTTGGRMQPVRIIVLGDSAVDAAVALSDLGKYVAIDVRNVDSVAAEPNEEEEDDGTGVRLYQAIYETALRQQVPRPVIADMIRVYSYDVDFQRKVQPGDSFEVLFAGEEDTPNPEARSDVLFASLTVGGETKKFYRFQTPDDNVVDYYDETGKSAKKFLVRKPSVVGIMRSGFGGRRHPILGYAKMHTGVDWAAPFGTPIFAAGNGVIEKVGWEGGYGKYIKVKHNNGYETAYGHMSAFARGIEAGTRVRQGQVIGFVGSTGLSTGAHVHYEILVNGRFVDPMRIKLPRGRSIEGPMISSFEKERDRLDGMMKLPAARVAQTVAAPTGATAQAGVK